MIKVICKFEDHFPHSKVIISTNNHYIIIFNLKFQKHLCKLNVTERDVGSIQGSGLFPASCWLCGNILVSYTRGSNEFSEKHFRKKSNHPNCDIVIMYSWQSTDCLLTDLLVCWHQQTWSQAPTKWAVTGNERFDRMHCLIARPRLIRLKKISSSTLSTWQNSIIKIFLEA